MRWKLRQPRLGIVVGMEFLCIGHRGAAGHEPENTVLAVRKALELGADGVEVDVYNAGGELMVIHDETLERTTNGKGPVTGKSVDYLRSLDAGKGERIPLLSEVFDAVEGRAFINVELKGPDTALPVRDLIAQYAARPRWNYDRFLVSSFDHLELSKAAHSRIPIGVLWRRPPRDWAAAASELEAASVNLHFKYVKLRLIEKAHSREMKVFAYTVNSPADIRRMRERGVDGIFTDYPERVFE